MRVKKSKHVEHYRDGYTPIVRCSLNRRHKVSSPNGEETWCTVRWSACPVSTDTSDLPWETSGGRYKEKRAKLSKSQVLAPYSPILKRKNKKIFG